MERFDDWARDRLPTGWVKTVPAPPPRTDDEMRSDLSFAGLMLLELLPGKRIPLAINIAFAAGAVLGLWSSWNRVRAALADVSSRAGRRA